MGEDLEGEVIKAQGNFGVVARVPYTECDGVFIVVCMSQHVLNNAF
jgi:hypothetical protein